jgi:hypothetical protein
MLLVICKRYNIFFCYYCLCFVLLICVGVACLDTTSYWVGCIAVLFMWGDYECSMWLVPLVKKVRGMCAAVW